MLSLFWDQTEESADVPTEEISPEIEALLVALEVPIELLNLDYGSQVH